MDAATRIRVRQRALNRCEYCRLRADVLDHPMHVDHVVAQQHKGTDDVENLALACSHCNLHKGPNVATIDPDGATLVRLFHPRHDDWEEHFTLQEAEIVGITATGRATVFVLAMNAPSRVEIRRLLIHLGEWP